MGNGAIFRNGGGALADVKKNAIYFCPLFTDFLTWLYDQDLDQLDELPDKIEVPRGSAKWQSPSEPRWPLAAIWSWWAAYDSFWWRIGVFDGATERPYNH